MAFYDIFWNDEDEDGNVAHIVEHGLTPEGVNAVLIAPEEIGISRSGPQDDLLPLGTRLMAGTFMSFMKRLTATPCPPLLPSK